MNENHTKDPSIGPWMLNELLGAGAGKHSTNPFLLGVVFKKLPLRLRRQWWRETDYGRRPPSLELVAAIADYVSATAKACAKMLWDQEHPKIYSCEAGSPPPDGLRQMTN